MKVKLVNPHAKLPTRGHPDDLGFDLYSVEEVTVYKNQVAIIDTGIQIEFPIGWGCKIMERGSQGKQGIFAVSGLIDPGYRGNIIVCLAGISSLEEPVITHYHIGDRVAQLVPIPAYILDPHQVDELSSSARGAGRFGSTGK